MRFVTILLSLSSCFLAGCQPAEIFQYKQSMISSGNNYPDFNFSKDHLDRLIVSLHNKISRDEFIKQFNWNSDDYTRAVSFLETKGFVKKINESFVPTCMVISRKNGEDLFKYAVPIAEEITDSIIAFLPFLKEKYKATHVSATKPFDSLSFFILSNVLLDNWQIGNVEQYFIHSERPSRHGKKYYYAFLDNSGSGTDPFGIYGNMGFESFSVYGNNQRTVNGKYISRKPEFLNGIDSLDNNILLQCSELFKSALIPILERNRQYANMIYHKSGYSKEVNFPEFFIWWYHFIYTKTTDNLSQKGVLRIPAGGNFYYRFL
jgi:hypothetical protein